MARARQHGAQIFLSRHFPRTGGLYVPSGGGAAVWFDEDFTAHGLSEAANYHGQTVDGQSPTLGAGTWADDDTNVYKATLVGNNGVYANGSGYHVGLRAGDAGVDLLDSDWTATVTFGKDTIIASRWFGIGVKHPTADTYFMGGLRFESAGTVFCANYWNSTASGVGAATDTTDIAAASVAVTVSYEAATNTITSTSGAGSQVTVLPGAFTGDTDAQDGTLQPALIVARAGNGSALRYEAGSHGP